MESVLLKRMLIGMMQIEEFLLIILNICCQITKILDIQNLQVHIFSISSFEHPKKLSANI